MSNNFCKVGEAGYIDWEGESDMVVVFEIPTQQVRAYLPKGISPVEARPGVSLLWMAIGTFKANCLNYLPGFNEPNVCVLVHNNLSKSDPSGKSKIPFMSIFVLSVVADNHDFLKHAYLIDKMPIHFCKNLQVKRDGYSAWAFDDDGPICDLVFEYPDFNTDLFQYDEVFIQVYTACEGKLYYQPVIVSAKKFEHQKRSEHCRLYDHPFFKGLDVSGIGPSQFYMQHLLDPTARTKMRFYTPEVVRSLQAGEWDPTINIII